ncbi:DUF5693 family protein [Ornithinibacillus xuwenensis]|uniref:DUF5693 family protein n=1 Tax=Ornithinibacillus xuwenensis TaxID=3144668 RepID=A0ABU9XGD5_9BACI
MKNRVIVWTLLILILLTSIPTVMNRWSAEARNNTYEIIAPYEEIYDLAVQGTQGMDDILRTLKEAGLTTVSLSPLSLSDLEDRGIVSIFDTEELIKALRFSDYQRELIPEDLGYYVSVPQNAYYDELIQTSLNPTLVTIQEEAFYFLAESEGTNRSSIVGYDEQAIEQIKNNNLNYLFRIENDDDNPEMNTQNVDALLSLHSEEKNNLLFSGAEVIGYPSPEQIQKHTQALHDAGYTFYWIEFASQSGMQTLARATNYNIVRLHSIDLNQKNLEENTNQAIRAIKERSIRSIIFHFQSDNPDTSIENAAAFIAGVHQSLPATFSQGIPDALDSITVPLWSIIALLIAGILYTFLFTSVLEQNWLKISAIAVMTGTAIAYLLLDRLLFLQAFALGIAIIAPTYAVLSTMATDKNITAQYGKALGINFIGIYLVIGLLNGNAFVTGMELFRGVKLVYVVPIMLVTILLFWKQAIHIVHKQGLKLLQAEVKYWHLLIFLLISAVGFYYISRTGNGGTVSEMELWIRNKLEEYLYVRPRTKEFLIGFPFYILGLYFVKKWEWVGKLLLLIGVIGFLSMMNTFTHLHIPISISLLRTAYSIVFGYVIGMVLIYLFKKLAPKLKTMTKRWN